MSGVVKERVRQGEERGVSHEGTWARVPSRGRKRLSKGPGEVNEWGGAEGRTRGSPKDRNSKRSCVSPQGEVGKGGDRVFKSE